MDDEMHDHTSTNMAYLIVHMQENLQHKLKRNERLQATT